MPAIPRQPLPVHWGCGWAVPTGTTAVGSALVFDPDAPQLGSEALEKLMRQYLAVQQLMHRLERRYDRPFLDQLIDSERFDPSWPTQEKVRWCVAVEQRLQRAAPPSGLQPGRRLGPRA